MVYEVTPGGGITIIAGNGTPGYSGDGCPASDASLMDPPRWLDAQGDLFIADAGNDVIREAGIPVDGIGEITPAGTIITVVGDYALGAGYSGDGGPAAQTQLDLDTYQHATSSLAVDPQGDLFIADSANGVVREVIAAPNTNGVGAVTPTSTITTWCRPSVAN